MIPKAIGWKEEDGPRVTALADALRNIVPDCGNPGDPVIRPGVSIAQSDAPLMDDSLRWLVDFSRRRQKAAKADDWKQWVVQLPHEDDWPVEAGPKFDIDAAERAGVYVEHFLAVGVRPDEVPEYLRWERRTLASPYFLLRDPRSSPAAIRKLAYRYALDARHEVDDEPGKVGIRPAGELSGAGGGAGKPFPAPAEQAERHRLGTMLSEAILSHLEDPDPNFYALLHGIEKVLGGEPKPSDTLKANTPPRLSYSIEGDVLRLWTGGTLVPGLRGKNEQALLKYFCENPKAEVRGRALQQRLGGQLTNASKATKAVGAAMREVNEQAGEWLLTDPLRWAADITPVPHPGTRQHLLPDNS